MSERATVFETTQIGVETTPGTAVPALKRLLCTGFNITPQIPVEPYRPFGSKAFTTAIERKEWTEGSIEGKLAFNDLVYLLSGYLENPAITIPGGATNTRRWTYLPKNWDPDDYKTFTVEKGSRFGASRSVYSVINSLELRFAPDDVSITGTVMGKGLTDGVQMSTNEVQLVDVDGASAGTFTLTFDSQTTGAIAYNASAATLQAALEALSNIEVGDVYVTLVAADQWSVEFRENYRQTNVSLMTMNTGGLTGAGGSAGVTTTTAGVAPTDIAALPVSPKSVSVFVADTIGGLSGGQLTRCLELTLSLPERFSSLFTLDDTESSFSAVVEKAVEIAGTLVVEHNSAAEALVTNLRNADTKYMQIVVEQDLIETNFPYRIEITFAFKFTSNTRDDQSDVWGSTFEFAPIYDATLGTFFKAVVDVTLTAL